MPSPEGVTSIAIVCEAPADRDIAAGLCDRVLCEAIKWIGDCLEQQREYRGLKRDDPHLEWHRVKEQAKAFPALRFHGRFGQPQDQRRPDAFNAWRAMMMLENAESVPDAVILLRDSDNDRDRRLGLAQARDDRQWPFTIVVGLAHTKRECWILAGFEPLNDKEEKRLREMTDELKFDVRSAAHRLAGKKGEVRCAKRVLEALTESDANRQRRCWAGSPLEKLRDRGGESGLRAFLEELHQRIPPLFANA